jgi:glucose-6-phosphate dehydrogenase assembly protein OpcA
MSNFVVFRDRVAPPDADPSVVVEGLPLDEIGARPPSRMIVVEHCRDEKQASVFSAGVGIVAFGPPHARYGVEQIVVRAACPDASLLSILRRFVRGDLPTSVWWTEDLSTAPPIDAFVEIGRQLLYDSRRWRDMRRGVAAMITAMADDRIDPADLNWRRLGPMRRLLEHAEGPVPSPAWRRLPVRLLPAPDEEALAWLCAGWLRAGRSAADGEVTIETPSASTAPNHLLTVIFGPFTATLTTRQCQLAGDRTPLVVAVPAESDADAIAAELRTLARDADLIAALRALAVA